MGGLPKFKADSRPTQGEGSLHTLSLSQFWLLFPEPVHSFALISGMLQTGNIFS